jgi:hypothetical protein
MLTRVQLFEKIRRDRRLEPDVSQRELARRHNVHRRTVRAALESAIPPPRKKRARGRLRVVDPAALWIDAMLREDLTAPRKQRHTIQRIHDRLRIERNFTDPRLCAAIVDRLTYNAHIIETGTESFRLAQTRARAENDGRG